MISNKNINIKMLVIFKENFSKILITKLIFKANTKNKI